MNTNMILSASGWRKIFAISNDEQDKTSLIGEENIALSVLAAKVFSDYLKAKTKKEKMMKDASIKTMEVANDHVTEIANEIIKTSYYEIKPITPEDAVLKLQAHPTHNFLAFINVETGKVNVIHKLKDGKNYGLVEPEA